MSYRQPRLKDQAALIRKTFADRGLSVGQGEALELVSQLNGYPSWNVAKRAQASSENAKVPTSLKFQVWTALHHHRFGASPYLFPFCPSEEQVIEAIEEADEWDPESDESVEVLGVEEFDIDVPLLMAKASAKQLPTPMVGVYEVNMTTLIDYETPDEIPAWDWIKQCSSFSHNGNNVEQGVYEFMVYAERLRDSLESAPELIRSEVVKALELGAVWVMFHQG